MARVRSKRTRPEMELHAQLKGRRIGHAMWPNWFGGDHGHPDIIVGSRTTVFVHGCFWHGCPRHFRAPKTNRAFWTAKIARNKLRHGQVARRLRKDGYRVVVVWEHDVKRSRIEAVIARIAEKQ